MNSYSFDSARIAAGYAKRPWLHKNAIERAVRDCGITGMFHNGLDVGCGAGLSAKALRLICERVTGTDISEAMIQVCWALYQEESYRFCAAKAEETPVPPEPYDIVTAAGVVNWVERDKFLTRMAEVMRKNGLLLVYDFWITDRITGESARGANGSRYTNWYRNEYLRRFPKPKRDEKVWTQEDLGTYFDMEKQTIYETAYPFGQEGFIDFMMIQSNVNEAVESGGADEREIREWMRFTLAPIFETGGIEAVFEGYNWYLRKA